MTRNLDMALLRTFVGVADCTSMTAAANTLNLTQSAVSQQIARLEAQLGHALFVRDRRQMRLTSHGERLLGQARRMLDLNDNIWADMTTARIDGRVRLGVPYDLASTSIASALKDYADAFPRVEISLQCASSPELARHLEAGEIDIAVIEEPVGPSRGECLGVERLVWVGARNGSAHRKTPLPISMVAETCAFRPAVLSALRGRGREWKTMFENGSIDATTATVRSDIAVTAWLAFTVPSDLDILSADDGLPDLPPFAINLHMPTHRARPATVELGRYIRQGITRGAAVAQLHGTCI
jgi:DNA-binding transcriptional LysR family regulator